MNSPTFPNRLADAWSVEKWKDVHVLVAVSGGPDSTALLCALGELKRAAGGAGQLFVAHVNHQLRGAESEADEAWVADHSARLGFPFVSRRLETAAHVKQQGDGVEAAARAGRYRALTEMAEELGARYVALGHTRDDQAETVLFRILRGTGLRGLAGIPAERVLSPAVTLVRPMLQIGRPGVDEYLESLGQTFRTDATNADARFTRNRIRGRILPKLEESFGGGVAFSLVVLAELAAEIQQFLDPLADELLEQCQCRVTTLADGSQEIVLDTTPLAGHSELLIREALRMAWRRAEFPQQEMDRPWWRRLTALALDAAGAPLNLPGDIRAARQGGELRITGAQTLKR